MRVEELRFAPNSEVHSLTIKEHNVTVSKKATYDSLQVILMDSWLYIIKFRDLKHFLK